MLKLSHAFSTQQFLELLVLHGFRGLLDAGGRAEIENSYIKECVLPKIPKATCLDIQAGIQSEVGCGIMPS